VYRNINTESLKMSQHSSACRKEGREECSSWEKHYYAYRLSPSPSVRFEVSDLKGSPQHMILISV
jgi:hypothetical protein